MHQRDDEISDMPTHYVANSDRKLRLGATTDTTCFAAMPPATAIHQRCQGGCGASRLNRTPIILITKQTAAAPSVAAMFW